MGKKKAKTRQRKSTEQSRVPALQFNEMRKLMEEVYGRYDGFTDAALERRRWALAEFARKASFVPWYARAPRAKAVTVRKFSSIDARGMQRICGRGDRWPHRSFNMDMWKSRDGRVFPRFWSRSKSVESVSYEVCGLKPVPPDPEALTRYSETNVPAQLRFKYDWWIAGNF